MTSGRITISLGCAAAVLTLAACGGSGTTTAATPGPAAEPAAAPVPTVDPAGTVVSVGDGPQGIAYDARTRTVAVAVRDPYRLAFLDPTTLATRRTVPLPGKVRHLQVSAAGGTVLAGAETADQLLQVPIDGGPVVTTDVQRHPHDAGGAANGEVVVGNEFSGSISFVRDGRVLGTVSDLRQPGGVVLDGDRVAVVDVGDFTLSTYDLASRRRTGRVAAGAGPTHVVVTGPDRVAVTDTRGNALLVYSLSPLRQLARLALPGSPYGLTADRTTHTAWVTLTATNQVVGVDVSGTPRVVARYPTVRQPDTVAVAPGSHTLWVTGTDDGVVQRIER